MAPDHDYTLKSFDFSCHLPYMSKLTTYSGAYLPLPLCGRASDNGETELFFDHAHLKFFFYIQYLPILSSVFKKKIIFDVHPLMVLCFVIFDIHPLWL